MSCCCIRIANPTAPPPTPRPENPCDWCDADLDTQVSCKIETQTIDSKEDAIYHVGMRCCILEGKHNDHVDEFIQRWNECPNMKVKIAKTPENVSKMFATAEDAHVRGVDRHSVKELFRYAWRTYNQMPPEDQSLVVH